MSKELIIIADLTPAIFTEKKALDSVVEDIKKRVANFNADVKTNKGRDEIRSFAHKIAQSKTALDNLGKDCKEEWKKRVDLIDAERKRVKETMQDLQDSVRKPLTDWEEAEEKRIESLKARIADLNITINTTDSSEQLKTYLRDIQSIEIDDTFAEFSELADSTKAETIRNLEAAIIASEKREADAAELELLRKEAAIRAQKDRDEAIRKEASEKAIRETEEKAKLEREAAERRELESKLAIENATKEAEKKIQAEREAAERKELELKLEAEKAQREKLEAEQRAERAVETERNRVAAEVAKLAADQAVRDANLKHRKGINISIREALLKLDCKITTEQAEDIIKAIVSGNVPNTKITY